MNITEAQVEKALDYLRDSAEEYAQWRSAERFYVQKIKAIEAAEFVEQEKGAVETKRMAARASERYNQALEDYREASYNAELLNARREAAHLKISFFQTMTKTQRAGY